MTAWQRSNITQRSEKGLGPISFKRILLAGGAGGIMAMIGGRLIGFFPGCLSGAIILGVVLAITHPVEGLVDLRLASTTQALLDDELAPALAGLR